MYIRLHLPKDDTYLGKSGVPDTLENSKVWEHPNDTGPDMTILKPIISSIMGLQDISKEIIPIEVLFFETETETAYASLHIVDTSVEIHIPKSHPTEGLVEAIGKCISDTLVTRKLGAIIGSRVSEAVAAATSAVTATSELEELIEQVKRETKADIVKPTETLRDYICTPELKIELEEIADIFKNAEAYSKLGVVLPKGVLLKGAPGTGKTYAARCIAGQTDAIFMVCTASALQGQYIGSGAENIRRVFYGARALRKASTKPVILFLDELDSFGTRERRGSSGDEENRTLNQLLAEMSGFENEHGILILGATNYPDRLDPAAMRSGRFSRQITIEYPEEDARQNLLEFYFGKIKMPRTKGAEDSLTLAQITKGFTPADIAELSNETALLALRKHMKELDIDTVNEAIDRIITKETRASSKGPDRQVSVHEAGHVLAEYLFQGTVSLKVTNFQYGSAGGFTQPNTENQTLMTKSMFYATIKTLLAGRAAEEVLCEEISVGASNDLKRASIMAENAICKYAFRMRTKDPMELQVQDLLQTLYSEVHNAFQETENKELLKTIADTLLKERVLYTPQLVACGLIPKEF